VPLSYVHCQFEEKFKVSKTKTTSNTYSSIAYIRNQVKKPRKECDWLRMTHVPRVQNENQNTSVRLYRLACYGYVQQ
jgi:uncharacterized protein YcfJ